MSFPAFFDAFPGIVLPFPDEVVQTRVIRSDAGLVIFFTFLQGLTIPMHAHGAQWGTVVEGEIALTIGEKTRSYGPGDSYSIPAGVPHGAVIRMRRLRPIGFWLAGCGDVMKRRAVGSSSGTTRRGPYAPSACCA